VALLENTASCKLAAVKRTRRPIRAVLLGLSTLLLAASAGAAGGSRLVYGRASGASVCPEEPELRAAVRARLGYDPFFPWADQTVVVHVAPRPNRRLNGKVYLVDSQGRASPEREFTTTDDECDELILALSLAIVITLDPLHGTTAAAAAAAAEKRAAAPDPKESNGQAARPASGGSGASTASNPAPESSATEARAGVGTDGARATDDAVADRGKAGAGNVSLAIDVGGGPILAGGLTPGVSSGFIPFVRARSSFGSVKVEGRYEVPVWSTLGTDRAAVTLAGVAVTPCVPWKVLRACPTLLLARYSAVGLDVAPQEDAALFVATGLRAGAEIPIGPRVWGFLWIEGLLNLTRHELMIGGDRVWQVPPFGVTVSVGAAASIL